MNKKVVRKRSAEPAGPEHRAKTVIKGRTVVLLTKGHHQGRPRGAKNRVPRGVRASVKAIIEEVVKGERKTLKDAFLGGLRGGPQHADRYLKLAAEYTDGKASETVNLNARWNQDELSTAREQLTKKMSGLLVAVLHASEDKS